MAIATRVDTEPVFHLRTGGRPRDGQAHGADHTRYVRGLPGAFRVSQVSTRRALFGHLLPSVVRDGCRPAVPSSRPPSFRSLGSGGGFTMGHDVPPMFDPFGVDGVCPPVVSFRRWFRSVGVRGPSGPLVDPMTGWIRVLGCRNG